MRLFYILILSSLIAGCAGKAIVKEPVKEEKAVIKSGEVKPVQEITASTGWTDKDTYTVTVKSQNLDKACEAARHKILQDIVKVRMFNESRYTDITKISSEFDKPLKEGKVISQREIDGGVQIYFQIRETGLKEKFEKK